MSTSAERAYRWLISGRVQAVGFRWFALRRADELGIVGWAKNLADGRVEAVGRGATAALDAFDAALRKGPWHARVDNVEKEDIPHEQIDIKFFDTR